MVAIAWHHTERAAAIFQSGADVNIQDVSKSDVSRCCYAVVSSLLCCL